MKPRVNFFPASMGHSHEIIHALYAYYQSRDSTQQSHIDFTMNKFVDPDAELNVYLDHMPDKAFDLSGFGMVLYSNGCEPLTNATQAIHHDLTQHDHCFLICNSMVTPEHDYANKLIWFPANILVLRDVWTRYFFPHFHTAVSMRNQIQRRPDMIFVNGRNDSNRHHFAKLLAEHCPDITQHSTISTTVHEINDSFFESDHDSDFRQTVNDLYQALIVRNTPTQYYENMPMCGIDGQFGSYPPGYSFMPCYFEYACVIFPESTWQNNELAITEKILKCFYAGCIPWPIGGSNLNHLYNQAGFFTAWNLLPDGLKDFDSEHDHVRRYRQVVEAIEWLHSHPGVMQSRRAKDIIESNREKFLTCHSAVGALAQFQILLEKHIA